MKQPLNDAGLDLIFRDARSFNGYTDAAVSESDLRAIWDLVKWGPTSANMEPARIAWVTSDEAKEKLAAVASETNADKIRKAPVTAIIGSDMEFYDKLPKLFPHVDARPWFTGNPAMIETSAFRNSTLQGAYLIIAARALGFDTGPMSGFDNAAVDAAFFAGTPVKSNFITTLGHGDPSTIFGRLPRLDFEEANSIV
ncbi:MAG: malonic semialdehyde reductase [Sphingomonas bacterium]|jgi:3-hydroxypropanoate dehydrogenase|nr:malonic semialdehyde reductase [Sphingomonas bacterium]